MDVRDVLEPQVGDDARGQAETPALSNVPTIERVPPDGLTQSSTRTRDPPPLAVWNRLPLLQSSQILHSLVQIADLDDGQAARYRASNVFAVVRRG